jgi:phospholipid transport system substrate-binding protein
VANTPLRKRQTSDDSGVQNPRNGRRLLRRVVSIIGLAFCVSALAPSLPAAADTEPTDFIQNLGNQVLEVIADSTSPYQKQIYFHQLFHQDFDLSQIARFVLGTYWRVASEPERQEFQQLFEYQLLMAYGPRLAEYRAEALRVTGKRPDQNGLIVTSQIIRPRGAAPIAVDWHLSVSDGLYKISDIFIEGISMAVTQRSEFAQVIQRNGGQVESLLAMMRKKVAIKS